MMYSMRTLHVYVTCRFGHGMLRLFLAGPVLSSQLFIVTQLETEPAGETDPFLSET